MGISPQWAFCIVTMFDRLSNSIFEGIVQGLTRKALQKYYRTYEEEEYADRFGD